MNQKNDLRMIVYWLFLISTSVFLLNYFYPSNPIFALMRANPLFQSVDVVVALITILSLPIIPMFVWAMRQVGEAIEG